MPLDVLFAVALFIGWCTGMGVLAAWLDEYRTVVVLEM